MSVTNVVGRSFGVEVAADTNGSTTTEGLENGVRVVEKFHEHRFEV